MEHVLLPEKYPGYIARFTKHEYSPCFKNYCTLTDSFFSQLELYPESINAAIESFVDNITASLPRFFGKKLALYDISRFLFLYTVPAALHRESDACSQFADRLIVEWNTRYPDITLSKATFSELFSGFRTRIMGFEIRE